MNDNISAEKILPIIDRFSDRHSAAVDNFYKRFYDNTVNSETFISETEMISEFFLKRGQNILKSSISKVLSFRVMLVRFY